jgi:hypothetical protein
LALLHHLTSNGGSAAALPAWPGMFRSLCYSVFSYLLARNGTLWALIGVQALLTVWLIRASIYTFQQGEVRLSFLKVLFLLTLFTNLPWVVSFCMPDIFGGLMVLCLASIILAWDDLRWGLRTTLIMMLAGSIVTHQTNLPLVAGLILIAMAMHWRSLLATWPRWIAVWSATAVAVAIMLTASVISFDKWSITPLNMPFALARSVEDGPARLYLRAHCPKINLVMCHHLDRLDVNADTFLWERNGVFGPASLQEQDAIMHEEWRIVIGAALEYPWLQAKTGIANYFDQLTLFNLRDADFGSSAHLTAAGMIIDSFGAYPIWLVGWSIIIYVGVITSCLGIAWAWAYGDVTPRVRRLVVLVVSAVLLNAFAGVISLPAARFGARMIWLLPLVAMILFASKRLPAWIISSWRVGRRSGWSCWFGLSECASNQGQSKD